MPEQAPDVRNKNFLEVCTGYSEQQAINEAMRCLRCRKKPCVSGCPVNIKIPDFIAKFAEDFEPLEIKGGVIDGKAASVDEIVALSKVPDPETLYSQVVYGLLFPFTKLAMLVKAVAEKKQEEDGAPAPAPAAEEAPAAEAEAPAEEAAAPVEEAAPAEA